MNDETNAVEISSGRVTALTFGAFFVGAGVGGGLAYLFTKRRVELKYRKIADNEIAEMREHYQAKSRALENNAQKTDLESIVTERGYSSSTANEGPPMAVQPPESVVIEEEDDSAVDEDNVPSPDVEEESPIKSTFNPTEADRREFQEKMEKVNEPPPKLEDRWDYQEELRTRSPDIPYVIHIDESDEMEGYQHVTLTYYDADDVLCNEKDEIVDHGAERERLVGERNLNLFGHGSGQPDVVYIRNDQLEIVFEVCRAEGSFSEEVHGFRHEDWNRGNLERMRVRERDDSEE